MAALASIAVISLIGLVSVEVEGPYLAMVMQVLVAVAVSTLMTDAIIHLLPHALLESSNGHSNSSTLTIICVYLLDNILSMMGTRHSSAKNIDPETE